jgi:acetate CoA/acetoacetate CoA-transferase beta subunit
VLTFSGGRATLLETAPGVAVQDVIASTEAVLTVPERVGQMVL